MKKHSIDWGLVIIVGICLIISIISIKHLIKTPVTSIFFYFAFLVTIMFGSIAISLGNDFLKEMLKGNIRNSFIKRIRDSQKRYTPVLEKLTEEIALVACIGLVVLSPFVLLRFLTFFPRWSIAFIVILTLTAYYFLLLIFGVGAIIEVLMDKLRK